MVYDPEKVLVTGFTGRLGARFGEYLLQTTDADVVAPFRSNRFSRPVFADRAIRDRLEGYFEQGRLKYVQLDSKYGYSSLDSVLFDGADVWHFAGSTNLSDEPISNHPALNPRLTQEVLDKVVEVGGRLFHVSTAYVCGDRSGRILESELELGQEFYNPYEVSKVECEHLILSAFDKGLNGAIFRPSMVFDSRGRWKAPLSEFYGPIVGAVLIDDIAGPTTKTFPLDAEGRLDLIDVDWFIESICAIAGYDGSNHITYHLTSADPIVMGDCLARVEAQFAESGNGSTFVLDPDFDISAYSFEDRVVYDASRHYFPYINSKDRTFDRSNLAQVPGVCLDNTFDIDSLVNRGFEVARSEEMDVFRKILG